ncbi:MAG: DUF4345 family protein [Erythrobacter sp.]
MCRFQSALGGWYPTFTGYVFLALGMASFIRPEILSYYAIDLDEPSARVAIRAMIGGGEVGIGVVLLFGGHINLSLSQRSLIAVAIFTCVGLSRLFAVTIEGTGLLTIQPVREAAIELTLGGVGLWAAWIAEFRSESTSI